MRKLLLLLIFVQNISMAASVMDKSQFQKKVYEYLEVAYPEYSFEKTLDREIIKYGEVEIGLQNIYNIYIREGLSNKDLEILLTDHFSRLLPQILEMGLDSTMSWLEAKSKVRVQLAPIEYLDKIELVHESIDDRIIIACVIDSEEGYTYVTSEELERWDISHKQLFEQAIYNLDQASKNMPLQVSLEGEKFIGIQIGDGYDAARILIPGIRKFAVEKLGSPYYAAVPNRDFLIMWSRDNSDGFNSFARNRVIEDHAEQPYPLTSSIFEVTVDGIVVSQ